MNVKQTVNISTNIHNERIKTKYIPSYIFENESKLFKTLKKQEVAAIYDVQILTVLCINFWSVNV